MRITTRMMHGLTKAGRYLELGRDEAQWLALFVSIVILVIMAAGALGLAVRFFMAAAGF